jgi:hypothetical protein
MLQRPLQTGLHLHLAELPDGEVQELQRLFKSISVLPFFLGLLQMARIFLITPPLSSSTLPNAA